MIKRIFYCIFILILLAIMIPLTPLLVAIGVLARLGQYGFWFGYEVTGDAIQYVFRNWFKKPKVPNDPTK